MDDAHPAAGFSDPPPPGPEPGSGPPPYPSARLRDWVLAVTTSPACTALGGGRFVLRVPLDDLAVDLGYARRSGSLSRRLRRLEDCGVVVSRRPVVFDVSRLDPVGAPVPLPSPPGPAVRASDPTPPRVPDLVPRSAVDSVGELALSSFRSGDREVCLRALAAVAFLAGAPQTADRPPPAEEPTAGDRAPIARNGDAFTKKKTSTTTSTTSTATSLPPLGSPSTTGRLLSLPPSRRARLQELLLPLLEECRRRGLPGMSSRTGVYEALAPLTDEEIADGVVMVCGLLAAGTPVRSPFGLLVSLARRGDLRGRRHEASGDALSPSSPVSGAPPPVRVPHADAADWLRDVRAFMTSTAPRPPGA